MRNIDPQTVAGFGDEWSRFDQSDLDAVEHQRLFSEYFSVFPWATIGSDAVGFDLGCGSGRWAKLVAERVQFLHCVDPSAQALRVARGNLAAHDNVRFWETSVGELPFGDSSMDFGYSLGVLHHVPDTQAGLSACVRKLKPGAPFLVYLYYRFDNRPLWFRGVWFLSDLLRRAISRLPHWLRFAVSQVLATVVYWPLARASALLERLGFSVSHLPLSSYRNASFYTMRTDALDRFGTRLEKRFTRLEIATMMERAGLTQIRFREGAPYWCALGIKGSPRP